MKKYIFIILLILSSCKTYKQEEIEDNYIFTCLIHTSGVEEETYFITLTNSRNLTTIFGEMQIGDGYISKLLNKKTIKLSEKDFNSILKLKDESLKLEEINRKNGVSDAWETDIRIDNKKYHFFWFEIQDTSLEKMLNEIKKVSPIKIDMHGW